MKAAGLFLNCTFMCWIIVLSIKVFIHPALGHLNIAAAPEHQEHFHPKPFQKCDVVFWFYGLTAAGRNDLRYLHTLGVGQPE